MGVRAELSLHMILWYHSSNYFEGGVVIWILICIWRWFPDIVSVNHNWPHQREDEQLLRVEGEVGSKVGGKEGSDGRLLLEPDAEQAEDEGSVDGGEEAAPVVTDGKVDGRYLDAEQDAADGGGESAGDADGARGREHLRVPALVLVDALERGHQLAEQRRHYAGDVDERPL